MSEVIKLNEDMIGNKVRCIYKADCYHPEIGTIGTIVDYDKRDEDANYKVQWPKGTTIGDDRWWAINRCIELVKDDVTTSQKTTDMTNEEIWEMIKPKMEKNGLEIAGYLQDSTGEVGCYDEDDVHNAIALAYRSGYIRAIKGRPFKISEKKKKSGHWVPVDPNNLPKEGTKVKLKKEYCNYYGGVVESGEIGIVFHDASYVTMVLGYGISFGKYKTVFLPLDRNIIANCLDMWVEDDE